MDPSEDFPHPPALFPPPAPAAAAPPPASTAASIVGPRIFVLSLLPGNKYEVDRYFYSPQADVTMGDYAALLAFATHYAYPLAILQCPDLAAFQASTPAAFVRPFDEVPVRLCFLPLPPRLLPAAVRRLLSLFSVSPRLALLR